MAGPLPAITNKRHKHELPDSVSNAWPTFDSPSLPRHNKHPDKYSRECATPEADDKCSPEWNLVKTKHYNITQSWYSARLCQFAEQLKGIQLVQKKACSNHLRVTAERRLVKPEIMEANIGKRTLSNSLNTTTTTTTTTTCMEQL